MYTYPFTQENLRGVTSVMLEAVCGPEYIHEEGGNSHCNIYDSDSDEGNIDEDGNAIGVFTLVANADDLDISDKKIVMEVVTAVIMILKTTQTRSIMIQRNLNPKDLKTFF